MSQENDLDKLPIGKKIIPSQEFIQYCETEFEKRLNTGEKFDQAAYRKAMDMVVTKLSQLEAERMA